MSTEKKPLTEEQIQRIRLIEMHAERATRNSARSRRIYLQKKKARG